MPWEYLTWQEPQREPPVGSEIGGMRSLLSFMAEGHLFYLQNLTEGKLLNGILTAGFRIDAPATPCNCTFLRKGLCGRAKCKTEASFLTPLLFPIQLAAFEGSRGSLAHAAPLAKFRRRVLSALSKARRSATEVVSTRSNSLHRLSAFTS